MRKYGQPLMTIFLIYDLAVLSLSWLLAYYIRFHVSIIPVTKGVPPIGSYIVIIPFILLMGAISFKLYGAGKKKRSLGDLPLIVKASSFMILLLIAVTFFYREHSYSRLVMMYFWFLNIVILGVSRRPFRNKLLQLWLKGSNVRRVIVVGSSELGQSLSEKIQYHPELGFEIVGFLTDDPAEVGSRIGGIRVLGELSDVQRVVKQWDIDQVYVTLPLSSYRSMEMVLSQLGEEMVDIKMVPDLFKFVRINSSVDEFEGFPIINLSESPMIGWNMILKRGMDVLISLATLAILSPLMGMIALLVKLTSPGPVFYVQERMGMDGKPFKMYKFRSMRMDAEKETGAVWADKDDDRRTRVGRFIRKTSLDETPQLYNVLKGEMSLVGPRPERPVLVEEFKRRVPKYMLRHKVKAGITGWAQVNGYRGKTSLERRIEHDIYYIENWSLLFDLKILLLTLWKGLVNKNAY